MIALIGCVKSKAKTKCMAKDMYTSPLFKMSYRYAKTITDDVYILSAKYGLIKDTTVISPYEETLKAKTKHEKKIWAFKVIESLKEANLINEDILLLAGEDYSCYIRQKLNTIEPLKGLKLGERLSWLKKHL